MTEAPTLVPLPVVVVTTLCDPLLSWEAVVVVVVVVDVIPMEDEADVIPMDDLVLCRAIRAVAVGIKCLIGGGVKVP